MTIKLEASAVLWAAKKCDHYLCGMPLFIVITNSKPLASLVNGSAESAVKSMKDLITKLGGRINSEEFKMASLSWRVTPYANGFGPAYGFNGRHLRALLPDVRDPHISA
eukprot:TCALIF_12396-PA protein Name:"Protein of unknown function" AED:0.48 eAED:0.48 QI:0/0/0/0.5/1/1/2/0/108